MGSGILTRMLWLVVIVCGGWLLLNNISSFFLDFDTSGSFRLFLLAGFYISLILLVVRWISKRFAKKPPPPVKLTDHGSAEWATQEQFIKAGNNFENEGLWLGDHYRRTKPGHLLTIAGSGAGKNACQIIPTLLVNPYGSYVITDPKGENAFITARNQRQCGQQVYILDPWNLQQQMGARHGVAPSCFNPFDFIKKDPSELRDNCELVASYLVPDNPNAKDPYWDDRARSLIKTCLMHIVTDMPIEKHTFWTLYRMIRVSGDGWLSLLADMKLNEACDGLISIAAEEFMGMDPGGNTMAGIRSNAQNATSIFESPQLQKAMERSDFDPYDLPNGNCTVYIVIPDRFIETHSAWLRMVIGLCLKAVNAKPNKRVNFLLDEFPMMGKMQDVQKAFAFGRGQNIVMWAFAQNLSQIRQIYGEDGMNAFISNTAVFMAFGIKDQFTKEYVSAATGDATFVKVSYNSGTTTGEKTSNSSGKSTQTFGRRLLTPEEVERMPNIIVFTEGLKFWIFKIGYYQNRFEGLDWQDKRLDPQNAKMIKSGKLPNDMREFFKERADPPPRVLV